MPTYELTFILSSQIGEQEIKGTIEQIEKNIVALEGEILKRFDWGLRPLAYPIKREAQGHYVTTFFKLAPEKTAALLNELPLISQLHRYLLIALDKEGVSFKRASQFSLTAESPSLSQPKRTRASRSFPAEETRVKEGPKA